MNYVEQRLIRERSNCGLADNVGRMLASESIESMASRTSQLENAFFPEFRLRTVVRVLAQSSADCTEEHQCQSNLCNDILCNDSPGHVALSYKLRT